MESIFGTIHGSSSRSKEKSSFLLRSQSEVKDQPCSTPSIPVKFLTKVIPSSERKGFNSQTKRFQHTENENPGPGCYNIIHQSALLNSVSQSRKGTCFFPSLDVRIARQRIPNYPAANAYSLPPTLKSKRDFSLGHSSMFHRPIARKITKKPTPAPNQYNVTVEFSKQSSGPGAQSAFVSGTKRSLSLRGKEHVPSPCHYQVNESFIRQSPVVLVSCFKSKTTRETNPETLSPGPAAYQNPAEVQLTAPRKFPGLGLRSSHPAETIFHLQHRQQMVASIMKRWVLQLDLGETLVCCVHHFCCEFCTNPLKRATHSLATKHENYTPLLGILSFL